MDTVEQYRQIVERILSAHAAIPYAYDDVQTHTVFDRAGDHYMLVDIGWETDGTRIHDIMAHLDIIDGKIWIQYDGLEDGIAAELEQSGIPREKIILAFQEPYCHPV